MHARLSNLSYKMVRQITVLTEFGNLHISLKRKDIFPKRNYPIVFVIPNSFCHTHTWAES